MQSHFQFMGTAGTSNKFLSGLKKRPSSSKPCPFQLKSQAQIEEKEQDGVKTEMTVYEPKPKSKLLLKTEEDGFNYGEGTTDDGGGRIFWNESERQIESFWQKELSKHLGLRISPLSAEQLKRIETMAKVYKHSKIRFVPWFTRPKFVKDKSGVRSTEPGYDPATLFIPDEEWQLFTPTMRQFWTYKQDNFDRILLFKLGRFYEMFYQDAIACHILLDLNWMGGKYKVHVGFPESQLPKFSERIVNFGFEVAVVDQTETTLMAKERIDLDRERAKSKAEPPVSREPFAVGRQMSQIITKSTLITDPSGDDYEPKWILSLKDDGHNQIGLVLFDMSTLQFKIGQFKDDSILATFRTAVSKMRPVEVVFDRENLSETLLRILKGQPIPPLLSSLSSQREQLTSFKGMSFCSSYFGPSVDRWPKVLADLRKDQGRYSLAWQAFTMLILHLKKNLVDQQTVPVSEYLLFDPLINQEATLVLDSQAILSLQLLEVEGGLKNKVKGSLFDYLNRCKTSFGKRLLKKWICSPLADIAAINERLDAVDDLISCPEALQFFQNRAWRIPDLDRCLSSIYSFAMRGQGSISFENVPVQKLKEFYSLLDHLKFVKIIISGLGQFHDKFSCPRLVALTSIKKSKKPPNSVDQVKSRIKAEREKEFMADNSPLKIRNDDPELFPDIDQAIAGFEALIMWQVSGPNGEKVPEPVKGCDQAYDLAKQRCLDLEENFRRILYRYRDALGQTGNQQIKFVNSRYRYELQIPNELFSQLKKLPPEFEMTASTKQFKRFVTPEIRKKTDELDTAEIKMRATIMPFICSIFAYFHSKRRVWSQVVTCLAEIDVLCSLAVVSSKSNGQMCRPEFIRREDNLFKPYLELRKMRHPCITLTFRPGCTGQESVETDVQASSNFQFIPNDTVLGSLVNKSYLRDDDTTNSSGASSPRKKSSVQTHEDESEPRVLLVTGPNMGGKSTLLRQTCLGVILAQIGCYVPAERCLLTPVDRVFTRIGAFDNILEGKSTFFVEMEETKAILEKATENSLAILDELGRGTSTYDGQALADSVLKYLVEKIKCLALYSTHYHTLSEKYAEVEEIEICQMTYSYDQKKNQLIYLYQLQKGACPSSFGINVAKITGIPPQVLARAQEKSDEFTRNMQHVILSKEKAKALTEAKNGVVQVGSYLNPAPTASSAPPEEATKLSASSPQKGSTDPSAEESSGKLSTVSSNNSNLF